MTALALEKAHYDVLNVVTLKKMASAGVVAGDTGASEADVSAVLAALSDQGLVALADDFALPTDDAEPALTEAAAQIYADVRTDAGVGSLVEKFETTNAQFLKAMSAWQQVDVGGRKVPNDHTDAAYDEKIIARLDRLIQALQGLLAALAQHDPRFRAYPRRFDAAMAAVDGGDRDRVSSPVKDSVHNVWFEFHEDLLRTLGRKRAE